MYKHRTEAAQLLGGVEHDGREARRHLGVETNLDARLDLVLALDKEVKQLCATTTTTDHQHYIRALSVKEQPLHTH
jgi:hypothetical protein